MCPINTLRAKSENSHGPRLWFVYTTWQQFAAYGFCVVHWAEAGDGVNTSAMECKVADHKLCLMWQKMAARLQTRGKCYFHTLLLRTLYGTTMSRIEKKKGKYFEGFTPDLERGRSQEWTADAAAAPH